MNKFAYVSILILTLAMLTGLAAGSEVIMEPIPVQGEMYTDPAVNFTKLDISRVMEI